MKEKREKKEKEKKEKEKKEKEKEKEKGRSELCIILFLRDYPEDRAPRSGRFY